MSIAERPILKERDFNIGRSALDILDLHWITKYSDHKVYYAPSFNFFNSPS